jgi:hypothetical protein
MITTYSVINEIASRYHAEYYLEFTNKNASHFNQITIENKKKIDITKIDYCEELCKNLSNTIDFNKKNIHLDIDCKFDILCFNQLKNYKLIFNLFLASIPFSHHDTIWIINNIFPVDPFSCLENKEKCLEFRKQFGLCNDVWTGNVYKICYIIHDKFPSISYCTVIHRDFSQLVIWKAQEILRPALCKNIDEIEKYHYFNAFEHPYIFMPVRYHFFYNILGLSLNPILYHEPDDWKKLIFSRCHTKKESQLRGIIAQLRHQQ